ncbi:alcohol dehydrogenase catalytic domain-containing protein [Desertihabitans aurantiacus]|uniref:alcohol dehydrogenase catalytic domain-containing protein n=1 Tax=Desertihabitans aurantiacus TaxID=2282477 RepID=UPI000DF7F5CD|nr:alcohol dehydrogenase catalytic domain-containing protein [Desertihabitans aurantiacus]
MQAAFLPGDSTVELREVQRPEPGHGQVLVQVRASTICGSDIRAIYREHLGTGAEAYQGVVGGHEPCGVVVETGPGVAERAVGDRVVVYHISGCGLCAECREGYQIACTSPRRAAYGWQRDGGHAEYLLAEERDLVVLPDALSFVDGACVACGFGTAYEAVVRAQVSGRDRVLVTGLGPVGLAAGLLARRLGATTVVGSDPVAERRAFALSIGAVTDVHEPGTPVPGTPFTVAVDASGNGAAQLTALTSLGRWGRCVLVGEGASLAVEDVSAVVIHPSLTVHGSWVTSLPRMAELLERLVEWDLHPEVVVTGRYGLAEAGTAYAEAAAGRTGKVVIEPQSGVRV